MDQFSLLSATVIIYHIKPYPFYYFFKILFTVEIFYKSCLFEEDEAKVEVMPALEHSVTDHTDRGLPAQVFVPLREMPAAPTLDRSVSPLNSATWHLFPWLSTVNNSLVPHISHPFPQQVQKYLTFIEQIIVSPCRC